jgi:hypothetical protein
MNDLKEKCFCVTGVLAPNIFGGAKENFRTDSIPTI